VFEVGDRKWRGVGMIPQSGLQLREEFRDLDAEHRFNVQAIDTMEPAVCIAGQILQGLRSRTIALRSAPSARRSTRWARPWCRRKARAQRITRTAGI